jgi:hypothetical protein
VGGREGLHTRHERLPGFAAFLSQHGDGTLREKQIIAGVHGKPCPLNGLER